MAGLEIGFKLFSHYIIDFKSGYIDADGCMNLHGEGKTREALIEFGLGYD